MASVRCFVCGADITGLLSIPTPRRGWGESEKPQQRSTCYEPEECVDRLQTTRDAWKMLAHALRARNKRRRAEAIERLKKLGEVT